MSAVIQFPGSIQQTEQINKTGRGSVMENKKRGFAALYRSLLDDDWTKDAYLLAAWTRLVLRASASEQTVNYNGQNWNIARGQLVIIPGRFANELRDRNGRPMSRDAVVRMLKWFESQNMIVMSGYDKGTVITICNYDPYQSLVSPVLSAQATAQQPAQSPAHHKPSDDAGLIVGAAQPSAYAPEHQTAPEEQPCKTTNINNQEQDQEIYGAGTADAAPAPDAQESKPDPIEKIPEGAALHKRNGKKLLWGTAEDVTTATWFIEIIAKAYNSRGLAEPKKPELISWVNDIRLMREHDGRSHHQICKLFAWVCRTGRELEFCQCPAKLRADWDKLTLRMANSETTSTKPMSNIAAAQARAQAIIAAGRGGYSDDTVL